MIYFAQEEKIFYLETANAGCVMRLLPNGICWARAVLMNAGLPLRHFEKEFVAVSFELKQV